MKLIGFDIETSNLEADFGTVLTFGWKVIGSGRRARVISIADYPRFLKDPTDDRDLVAEAQKILSEADAILTWYGKRFDVPYLNSRLLVHELPLLVPVPHIDGWEIARKKLKLHSNRLRTVSTFLGLEEKTPLKGPVWVRARAGHKPSLQYVKQHNLQDVEVLEQAYERLKPLIELHPSRPLIDDAVDGCPVCGSLKVHQRGFRVTRTRKYPRYQCQDCGAWLRGSKSVEKTNYITI